MPCSANHRPPRSTHCADRLLFLRRRPYSHVYVTRKSAAVIDAEIAEVLSDLDADVIVFGEQLQAVRGGRSRSRGTCRRTPGRRRCGVPPRRPTRSLRWSGRKANVTNGSSVTRRGERNDRQLHLHSDLQLLGRDVDQHRLDLDLSWKLDVPHRVRLELDRALVRRRFRPEPLHRPRPQRAGAAEQVTAHVGARATGQESCCGKRDRSASLAPAADQPADSLRPGEQSLANRPSDRCYHDRRHGSRPVSS